MSKWKYKEISKGSKKRQNGMMLEHRFIAERIIGRPLKTVEVVHHIDNDSTNNLKNNLMVFRSQADHARYHKGGIARICEDMIYECKYDKPTKACLYCGKETVNRTFCSAVCMHQGQRKVIRPNKIELQHLIENFSWLELGRRYGVTDNAVRKWAKSYNLL